MEQYPKVKELLGTDLLGRALSLMEDFHLRNARNHEMMGSRGPYPKDEKLFLKALEAVLQGLSVVGALDALDAAYWREWDRNARLLVLVRSAYQCPWLSVVGSANDGWRIDAEGSNADVQDLHSFRSEREALEAALEAAETKNKKAE